jgi:hypothetical protein
LSSSRASASRYTSTGWFGPEVGSRHASGSATRLGGLINGVKGPTSSATARCATHHNCRSACAQPDPTAAPTARCRTASTTPGARRRSSGVRAAAHGPASPSTASRWAPSRSLISARPWSAGALLPVGKAMPWDSAAAIGYPFGGTRIRAGLSSRGAGPDPQAEGDARRPAGGEGPNRRAVQRVAVPWGCTGKPGDLPPARSVWLPEQLPGKPAEGLTGLPTPRQLRPAPAPPSRSGRRW